MTVYISTNGSYERRYISSFKSLGLWRFDSTGCSRNVHVTHQISVGLIHWATKHWRVRNMAATCRKSKSTKLSSSTQTRAFLQHFKLLQADKNCWTVTWTGINSSRCGASLPPSAVALLSQGPCSSEPPWPDNGRFGLKVLKRPLAFCLWVFWRVNWHQNGTCLGENRQKLHTRVIANFVGLKRRTIRDIKVFIVSIDSSLCLWLDSSQ